MCDPVRTLSPYAYPRGCCSPHRRTHSQPCMPTRSPARVAHHSIARDWSCRVKGHCRRGRQAASAIKLANQRTRASSGDGSAARWNALSASLSSRSIPRSPSSRAFTAKPCGRALTAAASVGGGQPTHRPRSSRPAPPWARPAEGARSRASQVGRPRRVGIPPASGRRGRGDDRAAAPTSAWPANTMFGRRPGCALQHRAPRRAGGHALVGQRRSARKRLRRQAQVDSRVAGAQAFRRARGLGRAAPDSALEEGCRQRPDPRAPTTVGQGARVRGRPPHLSSAVACTPSQHGVVDVQGQSLGERAVDLAVLALTLQPRRRPTPRLGMAQDRPLADTAAATVGFGDLRSRLGDTEGNWPGASRARDRRPGQRRRQVDASALASAGGVASHGGRRPRSGRQRCSYRRAAIRCELRGRCAGAAVPDGTTVSHAVARRRCRWTRFRPWAFQAARNSSSAWRPRRLCEGATPGARGGACVSICYSSRVTTQVQPFSTTSRRATHKRQARADALQDRARHRCRRRVALSWRPRPETPRTAAVRQPGTELAQLSARRRRERVGAEAAVGVPSFRGTERELLSRCDGSSISASTPIVRPIRNPPGFDGVVGGSAACSASARSMHHQHAAVPR